MTDEHNFKVGDKVAVKRSYTLIANEYENIIPMGEVGIVENVDGEKLLVDFHADMRLKDYPSCLKITRRYITKWVIFLL